MKDRYRRSGRHSLLNVARLVLVVLVLVILPVPAHAATGDLDTTFGLSNSGINFTDPFGSHGADRIYGMALQSDGMIVAVGESGGHFVVARYLTGGLLDTTNFNATDGVVATAIGTSSVARAVAIQDDGKIVVAGSSSDGIRSYFTVARYDESGSLDTATFNTPTGYITSTFSVGNDIATSLVLQSDGRIVVAGYSNSRFVVARYTASGALDTSSFNAPNGFRTIVIGASDWAQAVGLQSDGKIVLAGHADTGESDDFAVARVTSAGALDSTFNGGLGFITTDFPTDRVDLGQALAIQSDDKIVVAGYSKDASDDFALARYNANGSLDTTFGSGGRVVTSIDTDDDQSFAVALQPTGRIMVAGTSINSTSGTADFAVARYTSAGVLDTTFGTIGYVTTNVDDHLGTAADTEDYLQAAVVQVDNKIVVGGFTDYPLGSGDDNLTIARYESPNSAPALAGLAKAGMEDTFIDFSTAEFSAQFVDVDGDNLAKVQVSALPLSGTLKLSGVDVTAGQEIWAFALNNLGYQPNANVNGTDAFGWNGSDGLAYADAGTIVAITVTAVNDAPVNTVPAATSVDEDTGKPGLIFSIADVDAGPAPTFQFSLFASHGGLTLTATTGLTATAGSNGSHLLSYQGTLADINTALGSVAYGPDPNFNGSDIIVLVADDTGNSGAGGPLQDTDSLTVTVIPVNDSPVLDPISAQYGNEDTVVGFSASATDVDTGQVLAFSMAAGAPTGAAINAASGAFTWTPGEADSPAVYTITVQAADNGDPMLSDTQNVTVTVYEVNDAPTFSGGPSQVVAEDAGAQLVNAWANNIQPGIADEATQALTSHVSSSNSALFADEPALSAATGNLSYTPAADANGTAAITVTLQDDGGTANNGADTSAPYYFTITVNAVNDAPTFTGGLGQLVDEDAGVQLVNGWATEIEPGAANEATQVVTAHVSTSNYALFADGPALAVPTGSLAYTPAPNAYGTAAITVTLQDNGGTANGGVDISAPYYFTITVNAVNDAPLVGDITRQGTANGVILALSDFLAAYDDVEGDSLAYVRITSLPVSGTLRSNGVPVTAGQEFAATGAVIGGLTYTPAAGSLSQSSFRWNGSDGLTYAAQDGLVTVNFVGSQTRLPLLAR